VQPEVIEYGGRARRVAGRLRYRTAPDPGTILGPTWTREYVVVAGTTDGVTTVVYALDEDRVDMGHREPRSMTEFRAHRALRMAGA